MFAYTGGLKGDTGDTGAKGDTGDTGGQGIQGVKGDKGDQGDAGGVTPLSLYTNLDSEAQVMAKSHAYLAATDGYVTGVCSSLDAGEELLLYVGATNDPQGAGVIVDQQDGGGNDYGQTAQGLVAEGEYFEFIAPDAVVILWKSIGTLSAPVDNN